MSEYSYSNTFSFKDIYSSLTVEMSGPETEREKACIWTQPFSNAAIKILQTYSFLQHISDSKHLFQTQT